ncbi:hypothetical protein [uncultured Microbacterium sp.]|uniref:hypothetical protein n=1 Tax=uncultured Microbacterium sp. TaxID=191216 RepID=UPI0025DC6960|nr:hypothetical protein [uncultured Microbacterium sp.]
MNAEIAAPKCSRAGCRAAATHRIVWRNPRIHGPEREKIWLACPEHLAFLHDYLRARDFPVRIDARIGEGEVE